MAKKTLDGAKQARQDEFYTQLNDISTEMHYYKEQFKNKVIFCNCDDPYESNFFKYFAMNFNFLGLKKLIATCYRGSPIANTQLSLFADEPIEDRTTKAPHKIEITEVNDYNGDGAFNLADVEWLLANKKNVLTRLDGDGDFRSQECIESLKESDIVVTNPPFSYFREFVSILVEHKKDFLIIGNTNALTYKEVFRLIKNNQMRTGYTNFNVGMYFFVPDDWKKYHKIENGQKLVRVSTSCWFTSLEVKKHKDYITLYKKYTDEEYPHYDNFDAIEVSKVSDIPMDWEGVMGVPITFLDKYNPEQFEIVGITKTWDGRANKIYPNQTQIGTDGSESVVSKLNDGAVMKIDAPPKNKTYYVVDKNYYIQLYVRVLIRRIGATQ